tara:strand:- start:2377 stop:2577 length:201 start_codon:yes stop_codon:yes gene_type:complete
MAISRGQMAAQISTPPGVNKNGKVKNKKRRLLPQSKKPLQGVAQRLRFGGSVKVPKGGRKKLGKLY